MPRVEQRQPEIEVGLKGEGAEIAPEWIERKGDREKVMAVLATWAEGGQGPAGRVFANRLNRTFFRVRLESGAIYEIAHELPDNRKSDARWVLVRQLQEEDETASPSAAPARPPKPAAARTASTPKAARRAAATPKAARSSDNAASKEKPKTSATAPAKSRRKPAKST